jgi:hypothetical protein
MATFVNRFATITTVLAAAVTNTNTFTVSYPTGTTQATFTQGLAGSNSYMVVNGNDKYLAAAAGAGTFAISYGASTITITNNTGLTLAAGASITFQFELVDGNDVEILSFPIALATITVAGDVVTDFRPGFAGTIEDISFVVGTPVTTAAKLATLNVEIGSTDLTGGLVALTSALATPLGKVIGGSAITANNTFTADQVISVEASAVTAFVEGTGTLYVRVRRAVANAY